MRDMHAADLHNSVRQIRDDLIRLRVLSEADLSLLLNQAPAIGRDPQQFVDALVRGSKLTPLQGKAVLQGKIEGLVLGSYLLLEKIGEGGMGKVYRARHLAMDRVVAIKVLPSEGAKSAAALERFRVETRGAASLEHPHIVSAYDAGEVRGVAFLVMEYVEGANLDDVVRTRAPLPLPLIVKWLGEAASALGHAHSRDVIHRDVKPSNLMIDRDDSLKLLDLGLARLKPTATTGEQGLTRTGAIFGTVDYMAPEQALNSRAADARSDIYSLGCTLYFLVARREIYPEETVLKIILAHRESPIPPLRKSRPDIPQALEFLYARMVAKDPAGRPQSMAEVTRTLNTIAAALVQKPARRIDAAVSPPVKRHQPAEWIDDLPSVKTTVITPRRDNRRTQVLTAARSADADNSSAEAEDNENDDAEQAASTAHRLSSSRTWAWGLLLIAALGLAGWFFTRPPATQVADRSGSGKSQDENLPQPPQPAPTAAEPVPTVHESRQINLGE